MNPKDQIAATKLPLELFPSTAIAVGCVAFLEGKLKYGRMNWRAQPVYGSVYFGAMLRHISLWFEGEDFDPDSLVPHLGSGLACNAILVDAGASGTLIDDRQYGSSQGYRDLVKSLLPAIEHLQALHKDRSPTHYSQAMEKPETSIFELNPADLRIDSWSSKPRSVFAVNPPNGVKIEHLPSGTIIYEDSERSQHQNRALALTRLREALNERAS